MSTLVLYILAIFLVLFLYEKVFKMYWKYYRLKSQGLPCMGFPLPLMGNGLKVMEATNKVGYNSYDLFTEYLRGRYGDSLPPIIVDFKTI